MLTNKHRFDREGMYTHKCARAHTHTHTRTHTHTHTHTHTYTHTHTHTHTSTHADYNSVRMQRVKSGQKTFSVHIDIYPFKLSKRRNMMCVCVCVCVCACVEIGRAHVWTP